MKNISKKSLHLSSTIDLLSLKKVDQKLAYNLLSQYEREGRSSFKLQVSVTELAAQLGSSREAVSKSLSELESMQCIKRDGAKVIILIMNCWKISYSNKKALVRESLKIYLSFFDRHISQCSK